MTDAPVGRASGLCEVGGEELDTPTVAHHLERDGVVLVRELITEDAARDLAAGCARARAARDAFLGDGHVLDRSWFDPVPSLESGFDAPLERGVANLCEAVLLVDSPQILAGLVRALTESRLLPVLSSMFGEPCVATMQKALVRQVPRALADEHIPAEIYPGWHQDGVDWPPETWAVDVWMAFEECGGSSPRRGLQLVPTKVRERLPVLDEIPGVTAPESVSELTRRHPPVTPLLHAGDALLFDSLLLHRSAPHGPFPEERSSAEIWFFAASTVPPQLDPLTFTDRAHLER